MVTIRLKTNYDSSLKETFLKFLNLLTENIFGTIENILATKVIN